MTERLLVDAMLGTLATYLRMCGHDAAYALDRGVEDDDRLLELAREEERRLLTRDRDLAGRVEDAILVTRTDIEGQLREVRTAGVDLSLDDPERCSRCNGDLRRVEGETTPGYAADPSETAVWVCTDCAQHYWKGSHWDDVRERLDSLSSW